MTSKYTFHESTSAAIPGSSASWPAGDGERIAPATDAGTLAGQVSIPFLQSLISGLGASAVVATAGYCFFTEDLSRLGPIVAMTGIGTFAASWAVLISDARGLLRIAESWGSPPEAPPAKPAERIIWLKAGNGPPDAIPAAAEPAQAEDPPQDGGDFERFMTLCLRTTAAATLERQFPRAYVQSMRDQLIRAGLGEWKGQSPRAGWALTARGRGVAISCTKGGK